MRAAIIFIVMISFISFTRCKYHGLEIISKQSITRTDLSNQKKIFDTLTDANKIIGKYNYDIINDFEGVSLELNNKNIFIIRHWSDMVGVIKQQNKGKWIIENKQLKLKYRNPFDKKTYKFYVMSLGKLTFIVPEQNMKTFFEIANNNSEKLDVYNKSYDDLYYKTIYTEIDMFKKCCLMKMKPQE